MSIAYGERIGDGRAILSYTTSTTDTTVTITYTLQYSFVNPNADYSAYSTTLRGSAAGTTADSVSVRETYDRTITLLSNKTVTYSRPASTSSTTATFNFAVISDKQRSQYPNGSTGSFTVTLNPRPKYTVYFNANGHGTQPTTQRIYAGLTATRPTNPSENYYAFGGWYTTSACTTAWDFSTPITKNVDLYAKWTANKATIAYNANGGTASGSTPISSTTVVSYNGTINLYDVTTFGLTKTGYHVNAGSEWNRNSSGTSTSYNQATNYAWTTFGSATAANTTTTVYANWKVNTFTVTYAAGTTATVTGLPGNSTKTYNIDIKLPTTIPSRTGYSFAGWSASTGGTYQAGATFSGNAGSHGATITMTATWTANRYNIKYSPNRAAGNTGSGTPPTTVKTYDSNANLWDGAGLTNYGTTAVANNQISAKTQFKLMSWNANSAGTGTSYMLNGPAPNVSVHTTLYAKWRLQYIYSAIADLKIIRTSTSASTDTTENDEGKWPYITFKWTKWASIDDNGNTTYAIPACAITIGTDRRGVTLSESDYNASDGYGVCRYKSPAAYSEDQSFPIIIELYDGTTTPIFSVTSRDILSPAIMPIDLYGSGTNVYMGIMTPYVPGQVLTVPDIYVSGDILLTLDSSDLTTTSGKLYKALSDIGWLT